MALRPTFHLPGRAARLSLALTLGLLLSACVTTTKTPQQKVDLKKAEQTHVQAGLGYLRQRDKESARRHFLKALGMNDNSAGAHNGIALVYQLEEEVELADKHFRRALKLQPDFSLARNNYGVFLFQQKRYQEAQKQLAQVAQDFGYNRRHFALVNLGKTQRKLGETDAAVKSFKQALGINYRIAAAHLELAQLYFDKTEYTLSKHYLDQFGKMSRQTPKSLWLGIRIERIFGNKDKEASYALALKNLHPYSEEYLEYKKTID
ncbi:type IV pilus biogenesis/stability protein PilW [Pseudomaricurvus alkylphenolicus]|jgi:type IV pilus assembly protein PilF|uniref:type IV pilus biogenesis/stability protein PilW n=1 Tax=Pseudomaricurvus alkylphenolicus TaxID=1306991 RepID=UPI001420175C|nr:type IV pilus biogenesis/stability protein PilW [Pseudomaricurvus alkylphenolicus]NIB43954.1 type IV pilus biogenesis/stability protein PilW [Pseudomaricurvus alkylphenolicus]